jgi:hypothetical protein
MTLGLTQPLTEMSRLRLKCDGTRAETRFLLQRNGRVHLNRRGRQFSHPLHSPVSPSVRNRVPSHFNWTLPGIFRGVQRRSVRRADNLTTFICRLSLNLGASTSWNLLGLSRPVMGLLTNRLPHFDITAIQFYNFQGENMLERQGIESKN